MERPQTGELPKSLTPLVGRGQQVRALIELLKSRDVRLVTLTGPGGIGKTRFAIEIARLVEGFPGGRWFVPLAPIREAHLIVPTVAHVLGLQETTAKSFETQIGALFGRRRALLILDNLEQIEDVAPVIGDLLEAAPALIVLTTSRSPLRVSGEREFAVPPLDLPPDGSETLKLTENSGAVSLFVSRTRARRPDFELNEANAAEVAEICRRLDGLPLAIELAAARMKVLSPRALLGRLAQSLQFLTGGPEDFPARLRTMRNAIDWSYQLLDSDEQSLFRHLSVFAGSFTLDAAEAVCGPSAEELSGSRSEPVASADGVQSLHWSSVLDGVSSLLDKSQLVVIETDEGEMRYRLLETVREYAREQLRESGEEAVARNRHAAWIARFVTQGAHNFYGPGEMDWTRRLVLDLDNIRAALDWTIESGDRERALQITGELDSLWAFGGYISEGRTWLSRAIALDSELVPADLRAQAYSAAGVNAWARGDLDEAHDFHTRSLSLWRESDNIYGPCKALMWLSQIAWYWGDYALMKTLAEQSINEAPQSVNAWVACAHTLRGIALLRTGVATEARTQLKQAAVLHRACKFSRGLVWTLQLQADQAHAERQLPASSRFHRESLAIATANGNRWGLFEEFAALALLARDSGRYLEAAHLIGAAEAISAISGVLPRAGREAFDDAIGAVESELGADAFIAARNASRTMDLVAAADLAAKTADAIAAEETIQANAPYALDPTQASILLSKRETQVLYLIADGLSDREIGDALSISHGTARTHARNILVKLGVTSRAAAVAHGLRRRLI